MIKIKSEDLNIEKPPAEVSDHEKTNSIATESNISTSNDELEVLVKETLKKIKNRRNAKPKINSICDDDDDFQRSKTQDQAVYLRRKDSMGMDLDKELLTPNDEERKNNQFHRN